MGQNWWFLFWQISVVLTHCLLLQGDIDKEGDFCGKTKLRGLTWFHLDSVSLHLSSLMPRGELCVVHLIWDGLGIRWETVLLCPVPSLTSVIEESLCSWDYNSSGDQSFAHSTMQMKRVKVTLDSLWKLSVCHFFPVVQAPKEMSSHRGCHLPVAADMEAACPRKVYFLPLCTASLSIGTAEGRLQSAPLNVNCGAVRGLGDDPRNLRRKSVGIGRENVSDPSLPTHIQRDGSGDRC